MTRRITRELGKETTATRCGDCPGLTGPNERRGCSYFSNGYYPNFLSTAEKRWDDEAGEVYEYERSPWCIEAENQSLLKSGGK